ncbi:MAG TPA: hypothetical protein VJY62_22195 [Bacteroidia bacterium]|nr:hypothetical protein [Bacteroidia bacterium]
MKYIFTTAILLAIATASYAQDRVFARTYQTNVLAKGSFDIEYWTTLRTGKVGAYSPFAFGRYLDNRIEFEFGLGKNIQTAVYFNTSNFKYALLDTSATEFPTQTDIETSFSNEWKFKLSDPVANKIGSALYLELTAGSDEYEIEGKIILDKRINNELFAFNLVGEFELETEVEKEGNGIEREMEWEAPVELDFAYMHFFKPTCGLGLEIRNHNEIAKGEGWEHSVLFGGPSFYFNQGKFWGVLNALPQIGNLHKTDAAQGSRVRDEHEDFEFRLLIGYSF